MEKPKVIIIRNQFGVYTIPIGRGGTSTFVTTPTYPYKVLKTYE